MYYLLFLFCLIIALALRIPRALFRKDLSDEDLIDLIGDSWKNDQEIFEMVSNYTAQFPDLQKISWNDLKKRLQSLLDSELLETRVGVARDRYVGIFFDVDEYRKNGNKCKIIKTNKLWSMPKIDYEGALCRLMGRAHGELS